MFYLQKFDVVFFSEKVYEEFPGAKVDVNHPYQITHVDLVDTQCAIAFAIADLIYNSAYQFYIEYDVRNRNRMKKFSNSIAKVYRLNQTYVLTKSIKNMMVTSATGQVLPGKTSLKKGTRIFINVGTISNIKAKKASLILNKADSDDGITYIVPIPNLEKAFIPVFDRKNEEQADEYVLLANIYELDSLSINHAVLNTLSEHPQLALNSEAREMIKYEVTQEIIDDDYIDYTLIQQTERLCLFSEPHRFIEETLFDNLLILTGMWKKTNQLTLGNVCIDVLNNRLKTLQQQANQNKSLHEEALKVTTAKNAEADLRLFFLDYFPSITKRISSEVDSYGIEFGDSKFLLEAVTTNNQFERKTDILGFLMLALILDFYIYLPRPYFSQCKMRLLKEMYLKWCCDFRNCFERIKAIDFGLTKESLDNAIIDYAISSGYSVFNYNPYLANFCHNEYLNIEMDCIAYPDITNEDSLNLFEMIEEDEQIDKEGSNI